MAAISGMSSQAIEEVEAFMSGLRKRNPGLVAADLIGPKVSAWMRCMEALPAVQKTWPPHWRG